MLSVIMGGLDGSAEQVAFDIRNVRKIITQENAKVTPSPDGGLFLEVDGKVYPVREPGNPGERKPYFLILKSGVAFNLKDYHLLFNVTELPESLLSGVDVTGHQRFCRWWSTDEVDTGGGRESAIEEIDEKLGAVNATLEELKDLKEMILKMKNGEFFEALTMEISGKIKEVAQELIDFRTDFQQKIQPDIMVMAAEDIPEASNQLEGINETLEESTMKIMDINEAQMDLAEGVLGRLESFLSGVNARNGLPGDVAKLLQGQREGLRRMRALSLNMMEPLSFQDLVGQRIQKIIGLVKSMETRIEDMIISLGLKIQKHKEDPTRSFEDLRGDVERYKCELKGPQKRGQGLDQNQIDELLATL
ncbi:MAG: protein phosphatase CheZ [Deltaproteobacteria bacterium]|nr:protein phosphatase CheZ [Deltaproteobacteria bacterium]